MWKEPSTNLYLNVYFLTIHKIIISLNNFVKQCIGVWIILYIIMSSNVQFKLSDPKEPPTNYSYFLNHFLSWHCFKGLLLLLLLLLL